MNEEIKNEVVENVAEIVEPEVVEDAIDGTQEIVEGFKFSPMVAVGGAVLALVVVGGIALAPKLGRWGKKKVETICENHKAKKVAKDEVIVGKVYNLEEIKAEIEAESKGEEE